jgi:hypothetical protein
MKMSVCQDMSQYPDVEEVCGNIAFRSGIRKVKIQKFPTSLLPTCPGRMGESTFIRLSASSFPKEFR